MSEYQVSEHPFGQSSGAFPGAAQQLDERAELRLVEVAELHEQQFGHLSRAETRALIDVLARVREHE